MLSKSKKKFIRSLELKKFRDESSCFLAEGNKLVADLLPYFDCELLLARPSWLATQGDVRTNELILAEYEDIESVSLLKNPQEVLAVFKQPAFDFDWKSVSGELCLVLDGIQDPGNLGTIIRLADWFGIANIVCSPGSADVYNPKSVQATMGALARVKVCYRHLPDFLKEVKDVPVYGTFLNGEDIYAQTLSPNGFIIMGNEGNGISDEVGAFVTDRLLIPPYPSGNETSESLNVAVATAITCAEFRRQQMSSRQIAVPVSE